MCLYFLARTYTLSGINTIKTPAFSENNLEFTFTFLNIVYTNHTGNGCWYIWGKDETSYGLEASGFKYLSQSLRFTAINSIWIDTSLWVHWLEEPLGLGYLDGAVFVLRINFWCSCCLGNNKSKRFFVWFLRGRLVVISGIREAVKESGWTLDSGAGTPAF